MPLKNRLRCAQRKKNSASPIAVVFAKQASADNFAHSKEFSQAHSPVPEDCVGTALTADMLKDIKNCSTCKASSKGRGFQGVVQALGDTRQDDAPHGSRFSPPPWVTGWTCCALPRVFKKQEITRARWVTLIAQCKISRSWQSMPNSGSWAVKGGSARASAAVFVVLKTRSQGEAGMNPLS